MNRMSITISMTAIATLAFILAIGMGGASPQTTALAAAKLRVGVYDSRAVAIAYGGSKYNDLSAKMKEYEQAKAAGDQTKIKELDAWGQKRQRQLHRQGFARVPVTDLLEPVKDLLPALAKEHGVSAIVFECNYLHQGVEKIDLTMDLVKLYEPSEKTMKWITEAMTKEPVSLDELNNDNP